MKKKTKILISVLIIVVLFIIGSAIWWFSPKHFLGNVNPTESASIEVFNGNDGNRFTITEKEDIEFLTEHIQAVTMKKDSISAGLGTTYNLRFLNKQGKELDSFIIMTHDLIRQGLILYKSSGELQQAEDYLIELERDKFPDTEWIKGQFEKAD